MVPVISRTNQVAHFEHDPAQGNKIRGGQVQPNVRNHGEGPSRGLFRDYEPSDGTFSSTSHLVFWMEPTMKVSPCWAQHRTAPTHSPAASPLLKAPRGKGLPRVEQEGGQ